MSFVSSRRRAIRSLFLSGAALATLCACAPDLGPAATLKPVGDYASAQSFQAPASDWPPTAGGRPMAIPNSTP